jgi:hypothetical protein
MTDAITPAHERRFYEITLAGHLDDRWSTWFGDTTITHEHDGTTTIRGSVADQAALHGLLARVRDLGVTLISLAMTETSRRSEAETRLPAEPTVLADQVPDLTCIRSP